MKKEFKVVYVIPSIQDSKGNCISDDTEVTVRILLDVSKLYCPEEIIGKSGKTLKTRCKVQYQDVGTMIIKCPYEKIRDLILNDNSRMVIKGFNNK